MEQEIAKIAERWDAFLIKIENRFQEIVNEAHAALPALLQVEHFDTTAFGVAWQGIKTQLKELISKISDTYQEKVTPALEEIQEREEAAVEDREGSLDEFYARFYPLYEREQSKGRTLEHQLDRELRIAEIRLPAAAAHLLYDEARKALARTFQCTQCQAPLPLRNNFFRSYYQTCDYCQTVNTFEPGTIARNVEHFALHALAEEAAFEEALAYYDMELKYRSQPDGEAPVLSKEELLQCYTAYAEKYLKARIEIIPDYANQYESDLASRIEHVRKWTLGEHGLDFSIPTNEERSR